MEQVETAIAAISDISRWARERGTGKLAAGAVAGK
jgi:hypothetical protein